MIYAGVDLSITLVDKRCQLMFIANQLLSIQLTYVDDLMNDEIRLYKYPQVLKDISGKRIGLHLILVTVCYMLFQCNPDISSCHSRNWVTLETLLNAYRKHSRSNKQCPCPTYEQHRPTKQLSHPASKN